MPIKLVASDLDGTLLDHNNLMPADNLKAIHTIQEKQINFAICTGKTYSITKDICKKCQASYGIFGNGTQILNLKTGEEIYKNLISLSDFEICYQLAHSHGLHVHLYTDTEILSEKLEYMDLRNFLLHGSVYESDSLTFRIVESLLEYVHTHPTQIFKLVISSMNSLESMKTTIKSQLALSVTLIKKRGIYKDTIIQKEYEYLDITPEHIGKGYALEYLKNFLQVDTTDTLSIGDNVNDIDMLQHSGIGVTLADSYDEVKQVATYTTSQSAANSGFAEAIQKYIL